MTSTTNLNLTLQATNTNPGTWGTVLNSQVITPLDSALGGTNIANVAGNTNVTLTTTQAGNLIHDLSGVLTGNIQYIFPAGTGRVLIVNNLTTGSFTVTVLTSGGTGVVVPQGTSQIVVIDSNTGVASIPVSAANLGALLVANNLSDVANAATALSNLSGAPINNTNLTGNTTIANVTVSGTATLNGTSTATTAAGGTNTTQIATTSFVQSAITNQPTINQPNIVGVTSTAAAATGSIGEIITANVVSGSALSISPSGTTINVTSISLTRGIWNVWGTVAITLTGTGGTILAGGVGTTSVTLPAANSGGVFQYPFTEDTTADAIGSTGTVPISIATTTTVYLIAQATFSGGSAKAYGNITAMRMR